LLVEGPYGKPAPVPSSSITAITSTLATTAAYNSLLFIAGGSSIAVLLGYIQQYVEDRLVTIGSSSSSSSGGVPTERNLHVMWAAREPAFVHRVLNDMNGNR
jgi:hypothetical protein